MATMTEVDYSYTVRKEKGIKITRNDTVKDEDIIPLHPKLKKIIGEFIGYNKEPLSMRRPVMYFLKYKYGVDKALAERIWGIYIGDIV